MAFLNGFGGAPVYDPAIATAGGGISTGVSSNEAVATGYVVNGTVDLAIQGAYQSPYAANGQDAVYTPPPGYTPADTALANPGGTATGEMGIYMGAANGGAAFNQTTGPDGASYQSAEMGGHTYYQSTGPQGSYQGVETTGFMAAPGTDPYAAPSMAGSPAAAGTPADPNATMSPLDVPGTVVPDGGFKKDAVVKSGGQAISQEDREKKKEEAAGRAGRNGGGSVGSGGGSSRSGQSSGSGSSKGSSSSSSSGSSKGEKVGTGLLWGSNYAQVAGNGSVKKTDQTLGNTDLKITGNADTGTMTKVQDGAWSEQAVRHTNTEWSASGAGSFGLNAQAGASYTLGPVAFDTSGKAFLGAEGRGSARFSGSPPVIQLGVEARIAAAVECKASAGIGPLRAEVSGYAMGGAEATAGGCVGVLQPTPEEKAAGVSSKMGAEVKAGAFAGAKAGGESTAEFPGGAVTAGGGVRAGVGAEVGAKMSMTTGRNGKKMIDASFNFGASMGIGFDIKLGAKLDVTGIINAAKAVDSFMRNTPMGPLWSIGKKIMGVGFKMCKKVLGRAFKFAMGSIKRGIKILTFGPKTLLKGFGKIAGIFKKKEPESKSSQTVLKGYAEKEGKTFKQVKNDANDFFENKAAGK
jgi:hypothetical protein